MNLKAGMFYSLIPYQGIPSPGMEGDSLLTHGGSCSAYFFTQRVRGYLPMLLLPLLPLLSPESGPFSIKAIPHRHAHRPI